MDMRDVLVADDDEERIDKLLEQLEELARKKSRSWMTLPR